MDTLLTALLMCVINAGAPNTFKEVPKDYCKFQATATKPSPIDFYWVDTSTTNFQLWNVREQRPAK